MGSIVGRDEKHPRKPDFWLGGAAGVLLFGVAVCVTFDRLSPWSVSPDQQCCPARYLFGGRCLADLRTFAAAVDFLLAPKSEIRMGRFSPAAEAASMGGDPQPATAYLWRVPLDILNPALITP